MTRLHSEKPALLVIDMVKDIFDSRPALPIVAQALPTIAPINRISALFRKNGWPVVFSTDAFNEDDFIFSAGMHPHALAGTPGAEVIDALDRTDQDHWLPKPRLSAFFQTGLETWLRDRSVTLCAVAGVATHFCVLTTVMDAICHDFKAVLLQDCTAAPSDRIHEQILNTYRRNPLFPLLQVISSDELTMQLRQAEDAQ